MAAILGRAPHLSWNPLAYAGTPMRPNTLLMAKLTILLLLIAGYPLRSLSYPGVLATSSPMLRQLDWLGPFATGTFIVAGLCILFNRFVRHASMLAGLIVGSAVIFSPANPHLGALLCAGILLLSGFQGRHEHPSFVQWQVVVAHFALFLGATNGPAWTGGLTAGSWIPEDVSSSLFAQAGRLLPTGAWEHTVAWLVLLLELGLTAGLAIKPIRRFAAVTSLFLHSILLAFMSTDETTFLVGALAIGLLAFLRWPQSTVTVIWPRSCGWPIWLRHLLIRMDWDRELDWPVPRDPDGLLEVAHDGRSLKGWSAVSLVTLFQPTFYFALFATLVALHTLAPTAFRYSTVAGLLLLAVLALAPPLLRHSNSRRAPIVKVEQIIGAE